MGLARGPAGEVILNPDEEVQARIRLVFEKFREICSTGGVMRYLRAAQLPLPARPRVGPAPVRGWSGNLHGLQPFSICSTIPPMREPTSMGVSCLIQHVAPQHTRREGGFSSRLTSGRFVCTRDIQHISRGKNLERIRRNYAPTACAIERSGLAWHAKDRR